jgi:hypothetical protein
MLCAAIAPPSFSHRERAPFRAVSGLSVGLVVFGMASVQCGLSQARRMLASTIKL